MQSIPIALSSDNSGFFMLATTLVSALANKKPESFYEVYVFCAGDVTEQNKTKLREVEKHYSAFSLTFVDMAGQFENVPRTHKYVTTPSLYKMIFAAYFPQYTKMLYIDTDVLVRADLTELFLQDIGDNYLGGVPTLINYFRSYKSAMEQTGLASMDFYINAGVLLMNLEAIRRDGIDMQWQARIGTMQGSVDQHILNSVCKENVTLLPCKYNVSQVDMPHYKNGDAYVFYTPKEVREAYENPVIFHYTGKEKPWNYHDLFLANEWYRYFLLSPFFDKPLTRKWSNELLNSKLKWYNKLFYKEKLPDGRRNIYLMRIRIFSYQRLY